MNRIWLAALALLLIANTPKEQAMDLIEQGKEADAFALIEKSANRGDAESIAYLAWFYDNGRHVEQDIARASTLYRKAAEQGDSYAQWRLGVLMDEGLTEGSVEQAVELFRQAVAQGSTNAMTSLAVMHATGRGVAKDYAATRRYYQMAAENGNPHALQGLGVLYMNGEGVEKSRVEAMAHWLLALSLGSETASGYYQLVSKQIDDAEMHAIFKRANALSEQYGYENRFEAWDGAED